MTQTPQDIVKKYNGLSDFMRNATEEDKRAVFDDVAQKANEDQRKMMTPTVEDVVEEFVGWYFGKEEHWSQHDYPRANAMREKLSTTLTKRDEQMKAEERKRIIKLVESCDTIDAGLLRKEVVLAAIKNEL